MNFLIGKMRIIPTFVVRTQRYPFLQTYKSQRGIDTQSSHSFKLELINELYINDTFSVLVRNFLT